MVWRRWPLLVLFATTMTAAAPPAPPAPPSTRPGSATPCDVTVDGRVELICVLFRLAGNREYNWGRLTSYREDVDRYFAPHREHDAVRHARRLAFRQGAGYDAPMSLAVHLTPDLAERVPFDPRPDGLDTRLAPEPTRQFLAAARRFAADTKFDAFLRSHRDLYAVATERMSRTLADHARLQWFDAYFGPRDPRSPRDPRHAGTAEGQGGREGGREGAREGGPEGGGARFHLVLGLLNGPCNYGARVAAPDGDHLYSILGVWDEDDDGLPRFGKSVVPTVIHEFGHAYVNPVVDRHLDALRPAGEKLFARVEQTMRRQAYGQWETVMRESVLRACVVRYRFAVDGPLAGAAELAEQTLRGFTWVPALAQRLGEYEAHRDRYPTFDAFMPRVVDYFNDHAARLDPPPPP